MEPSDRDNDPAIRAPEAPGRCDVVIIGAGVIGLAIAWRAAQADLSVCLIDPAPGQGASWAAAGMLAPVAESGFGEADLTELTMEAAAIWPAFARDLEAASDQAVQFRADGTLLVASDPSDRTALQQILDHHQRLALPVQPLSAGELRSIEPLLAPGISGGAMLPRDHQVDNRQVVEALITAALDAGVTMIPGPVTEVVTANATVAGVQMSDGSSIAAAAVVVAAGSESGLLAGLGPGQTPPVRPVRGLTVRLHSDRGPRLTRTVRAIVGGRPCYLVPRHDGALILGATVEERGFDRAIPVGGLADLLADARKVLPALDEYVVVELASGLRPGSPDNGPIVGPTEIGGLLMATGHYRNGILLAPATADDIVAHLVGRSLGPGPFDAFRPGRFPAESTTS